MATAPTRSGDDPPSMSRYRSVRKASRTPDAESQPPLPIANPPTHHEDTSLSRSRSRYKRPAHPHSAHALPEQSIPDVPLVPILPRQDSRLRLESQKQRSPIAIRPVRTDTASTQASQPSAVPLAPILKKSASHSKIVTSRPSRDPPARQLSGPLAGTQTGSARPSHHSAGVPKTSSTPDLKRRALIQHAATSPVNPSARYDRNRIAQPQPQPLPYTSLASHVSQSQTAMQEAKQILDAEAERQRQLKRKMRAQRAATEKDEKDRRHRAQRLEQDMAHEARRQFEDRRQADLQKSEQRHREVIQPQQQRSQDQVPLQKSLPDKINGGASKAKMLTDSSNPTPRPSVSRDVLGFLKRTKTGSEDTESSEGRQTTAPSSPDRRRHSQVPRGLIASGKLPTKSSAPGADAPLSAVNAGERRVIVACGKSTMMFPVTPTTTPIDLIRTASTVMSEPIDYKASVLLEDFGKVGVQRPLRNYEHIRDVLNSWDDDKQHNLVLIPSATGGNDPDLNEGSIPPEEPGPLSLWMQYSQKPGKWEKRWVTLQQNGQITQAKKETDNPKDVINMCHMSDFDIYTPTAKAASRKVKPPKKHCFAMKSQQKSAMFESLENFVHFVCTGDKTTAALWYNAVQGWRSWYLVNVLGEGFEKTRYPVAGADAAQDSLQAPGGRDSHYQLGSFQPLLDLDMFGKGPSHLDTSFSAPDESTDIRAAQNFLNKVQRSSTQKVPSAWQHAQSATPRDDGRAEHTRGRSTSTSAPGHHRARSSTATARDREAAFAPKGLLGSDNYAQRIKAQRDRESNQPNANPFTGGLLSEPNDSAEDSLAQRSSTDHAARGRGILLDLVISDASAQDTTGASRGRGFIPTTIGSRGLIENATSSNALERTKTARHVRNRSSGAQARNAGDSGSHALPAHLTARERTSLNAANDVELADGSLLAQAAASGQIGKGATEYARGRGIMQGSAAKGPMLDLRGESVFAGGSLLRQVEGPDAGMPKVGEIDRSRDDEVNVKVGEAL